MKVNSLTQGYPVSNLAQSPCMFSAMTWNTAHKVTASPYAVVPKN